MSFMVFIASIRTLPVVTCSVDDCPFVSESKKNGFVPSRPECYYRYKAGINRFRGAYRPIRRTRAHIFFHIGVSGRPPDHVVEFVEIRRQKAENLKAPARPFLSLINQLRPSSQSKPNLPFPSTVIELAPTSELAPPTSQISTSAIFITEPSSFFTTSRTKSVNIRAWEGLNIVGQDKSYHRKLEENERARI